MGCKYERREAILQKLHELGGDFDGGDEDVGEFDEEAAGPGAADCLEAAFVAVEGAADYADGAAAQGRGQFLGTVELRIGGNGDGADEAVHVIVGHDYRLAVVAAGGVAVLERRGAADYGVDDGTGGIDEQQIRHQGEEPALLLPSGNAEFPRHGSEHLKMLLGKLSVGRQFCVGPLQVAHRIPAHVIA